MIKTNCSGVHYALYWKIYTLQTLNKALRRLDNLGYCGLFYNGTGVNILARPVILNLPSVGFRDMIGHNFYG